MLKKLPKILLFSALLLIGLVGIYYLLAKLLGKIEVDGEACEEPTITCYLKSNGAHTDLVLPVKNEQYNWSSFINQWYNKSKLENPKYIAFGWGDKGFYLNTPKWADLTFKTAFKAGFGLSTSAMHVTYYNKIRETERCVKLEICQTQYELLVKNIQKKFQQKKGVLNPINTNQNYGNHDSFYEAHDVYSLFTTCNVWVSTVLKESKIRAGFWTPFSEEVLSIYRK